MGSNSTGSDIKVLLLLSGPIAVGKSSIAHHLISEYGFKSIRTGSFLRAMAEARDMKADRTSLQNLGDLLDLETDFWWVVDRVALPEVAREQDQERWLMDSVRKRKQVLHFKARFGEAVRHVHLLASEDVLRQRYSDRIRSGQEYSGAVSYEDATMHPNEIETRSLCDVAEIVLDVSSLSASDVAKSVVEKLAERLKCGKLS